jgi:flavin reductase (DIM6/NTAB) family NADH-FMN oxidoreductase RutF
MNIETFFKLSYGLYIVSSHFEGKLNGHINNTVFQVTAEPPKLAVCSHKNNLTTDYILKSKSLTISIIQERVDLEYIGHFGFKSGREFNKFANINYKLLNPAVQLY